MKKFGKFKMPNAAITDNSFSYSGKRVAAVLFCHCNRLGTYRKSLDGLADLCKLSVPTVRKAVAELAAAGFISRRKCYVHDDVLNRPIYAQTEYSCNLAYQGGYMIQLLPELRDSQRREVYKYMKANLSTPAKEAAPPHLIPFRSQIYDLQRNCFMDYTPEHVFLNRFPYNYKPDAKPCPIVTDTIEQIADGNQEVISSLITYRLFSIL